MTEREPKESIPQSRWDFGICLALTAGCMALFTTWAYRLVGRRNSPAPADFSTVADFAKLTPVPYETLVTGFVVLLTLFICLRKNHFVSWRNAVCLAMLTGLSVMAPMVFSFGYYFVLWAVAGLGAILLCALLAPPKDNFRHESSSKDLKLALGLWGLVTFVMCLFSMHRHASYGSGSWDMGCMIHNFYRASRFLDTTSTVLGDVDFLGDHFMVGIYLYAPLYWLNSSGYMLLGIQSVNLAAATPAIFLVARHKGAPMLAAIAIAMATGLSFGLQSAAYFDSHEITVGFGFLCWAIWAFETGRLKTATILLILFSLFKESLGAYVVGFGLLALWRSLRAEELRDTAEPSRGVWLRYGLIWIAYGVVWFVLVNRVFMPALIARANLPEPHETFADFGPTVFTAAQGMLSNPLKALAALFIPAAKVQSQLVTLGGMGWLSLASPQIAIAALPLFAERFLSSKATMWEMGYHYAAPLCLYAGWAVSVGWPRLVAGFQRSLDRIGEWFGDRVSLWLAFHLVFSMLLINGAGYQHPANFLRWEMSYFSAPEKQNAHAEAISLLRNEPVSARIAAQNRLLPHLADRPVIYRLHDWEKTDWVLLSVGENAWPRPDSYPAMLARQLKKSGDWDLIYSRESTAIFARKGKHKRAIVQPSTLLRL